MNAGVGVGWGEVVLANSNGVKGYQKMTAFDASVEVAARSGKTMYSATDGGSSRRLDEGLIGRIGGNAKDHALMGLKQTKEPTGNLPVIFDPLSIGFILLGAIGGGANAESV